MRNWKTKNIRKKKVIGCRKKAFLFVNIVRIFFGEKRKTKNHQGRSWLKASVFLVLSTCCCALLSVNERQSVNNHPESKRRTRNDVFVWVCVFFQKRLTNIYKGNKKRNENRWGGKDRQRKKKKRDKEEEPTINLNGLSSCAGWFVCERKKEKEIDFFFFFFHCLCVCVRRRLARSFIVVWWWALIRWRNLQRLGIIWNRRDRLQNQRPGEVDRNRPGRSR